LKAIISEHPNHVPTGIGNNSSGYNVSLLLPPIPHSHTSELGDTSSDGIQFDEVLAGTKKDSDDGDESKEGSGLDSGAGEEEEEAQIGGKCKANAFKEKKSAVSKKTAAQSGKSIAATQPATKKPRMGVKNMNAVLVKEEETTQKLFELKKTKVKAETEKQVARVKAKVDVKMQADK